MDGLFLQYLTPCPTGAMNWAPTNHAINYKGDNSLLKCRTFIASVRDTLLVLDLLENSLLPNSKLIGAVKAWADNQKRVCELWGYCPA